MSWSEKQLQVLDWSNQEGEIACLDGAIRAGKTYSASAGMFLYTQALSQPYAHLIGGRKLSTIKSEIVPVFRDLAKVFGIEYNFNRQENIIYCGNQEYHLIASNNETSIDLLLGKTFHSEIIDETTLCAEMYVETAVSRMTFDDGKCWMCCNPSYPMHFVKKKWIDAGRVDYRLTFFQDDNPELSEKKKATYRERHSGVFLQRMIEAQWTAAEGLCITNIHLGDRKAPVRSCTVGVDYGPASYTAFVAIEHLKDGTFFIPETMTIEGGSDLINQTDSELGEKLHRFVRKHNAKQVVIDGKAASFRTEMMKMPGRGYTVMKGANAAGDLVPTLRHCDNVMARGLVIIGDPALGYDNERLIESCQSYHWHPERPDTPEKDGSEHWVDALRYGVDKAVKLPLLEQLKLPEGF